MRTVSLCLGSLQASRLGFGLSGLHHLLRSRDRQRLLEAAFSTGVRYFDAAPSYGHGLAERELGRFLGPRRHSIVVATKFGIEPDFLSARLAPWMYARLAAVNVARRVTGNKRWGSTPLRDYRAARAESSVERSLRTLRTDYIDVLLVHEPILEQLPDPEELLTTLNRLRRDGKVRYFGLAGSFEHCMQIARRYPPLGEFLQLDIHTAAHEISIAGLRPQASFGHFRARGASMRQLVAEAIRAHPSGVILYSTRKVDHLRETVALLETLERADT
jgi:aryl-alcohol dehydrogenase-like predicted oxidoreductase